MCVINDCSLKEPLIESRKSRKTLKGNYRALRNVLSHLWRRIQHSLVRQGNTLNWHGSQEAVAGLQRTHSYSTASVHVHRAGLVALSTQLARWILERRCTMDGWATNISWTGKCLFLQLLTTWDHQGRKSASLSTACCSLPLTPTLPRPQDVATTAAANSTPRNTLLGAPSASTNTWF